MRDEGAAEGQGIEATTSSTAARIRSRVVRDESKCRVMSFSLRSALTEAFLELALALLDLAADLGRLVAAELAGLFLDLAFGLVPLAFDLVVHAKPPLPTARGPITSEGICDAIPGSFSSGWCHP